MTSSSKALSNTCKYLLRMVFIMVILSVGLGVFRANAFGAINDTSYEIINYDFKAVVKKNHVYEVTKKVTVNIPNNLSELKFDIPTGNYMVGKANVKGTDFELRKDGNKYNIIIKDKTKLKKGKHTYDITYVVREYADKNKNYDLFYLNALSSDWEVPIQNYKFTLVLPDDFPRDDLQYYAGQFGSQDVSNKTSYTVDDNVITMTGSLIPADFGIRRSSPTGIGRNRLTTNGPSGSEVCCSWVQGH